MDDFRKYTIGRLREFNAPAVLIRLASGEKIRGSLGYELQEPHAFHGGSDMPFDGDLIPLWETNGDSITAIVDREPHQVIRWYYEDGPEKYELVGHSIREAIENKLSWLFLDCGYSVDEIVDAARLCEHPTPEEFVQSLQQRGPDA